METDRLHDIDAAIAEKVVLINNLQIELNNSEKGDWFGGIFKYSLFAVAEDTFDGTERLKEELKSAKAQLQNLEKERARILQSMGVEAAGGSVNWVVVISIILIAVILVKKVL